MQPFLREDRILRAPPLSNRNISQRRGAVQTRKAGINRGNRTVNIHYGDVIRHHCVTPRVQCRGDKGFARGGITQERNGPRAQIHATRMQGHITPLVEQNRNSQALRQTTEHFQINSGYGIAYDLSPVTDSACADLVIVKIGVMRLELQTETGIRMQSAPGALASRDASQHRRALPARSDQAAEYRIEFPFHKQDRNTSEGSGSCCGQCTVSLVARAGSLCEFLHRAVNEQLGSGIQASCALSSSVSEAGNFSWSFVISVAPFTRFLSEASRVLSTLSLYASCLSMTSMLCLLHGYQARLRQPLGQVRLRTACNGEFTLRDTLGI